MQGKNFKLVISYDGTSFYGWQKLTGRDTIQGRMEEIAGLLNGEPTVVNGAGRTDRGVHAEGQTATLVIKPEITAEEVKKYFNRHLPESIKVESAEEVPERFHARLSAKAKIYEYRVWLGSKAPVFQRKYVYCYDKKTDGEKIAKAAEKLIGVKDFKGFSSKSPGNKSTVRNLMSVSAETEGELLRLNFKGDGFLYNQIRIMTGTLLEIGSGDKDEDVIDRAFETGDRALAGFTAPAMGLTLVKVFYPEDM